MTAKELREKRAKIAAEIRRMADAGEASDASGNFTEAWVKVNADYNVMTRQIEIAETADRVMAEQGQRDDWRREVGRHDADGRDHRDGRDGESDERMRARALRAWFDTQMGDESCSEETMAACKALRFNPRAGTLRMPLFSTRDYRALQRPFQSTHPLLVGRQLEAMKNFADYRASMTIGNGTLGGYLVPPESLVRNLEINMLYYGGMRQVSETIRTVSGERMSWPTADDTSNAGIQIGESKPVMPSGGGTGQGTDMTLAKVYWDAYKFSSQAILVPYELIQDSAFNLPEIIGELFGIRLGRITNTKFTVGSGSATPMGLVSKLVAIGQDTLTYPTGYKLGYIKSINAARVIYDDVVNLEHSVDPAYRKNAMFMAHDQFYLSLRQLKDGVGRPLWASNIREGAPDSLDGHPCVINQDFDSATTSGKNVLTYGDHSYYKIRTVGETRFYRLEERYRDTDQDGFIAMTREDGNLLTAGTQPVKLLQVT
jgi:HK97 family phage major capsid protein